MSVTKERSESSWDCRFLKLCQEISAWSKDPSTKVGAVIVDESHRIISTGYNGLPRGIDDSHERLSDRETKLAITLHAEQNAILFANTDLTGCTLYCTHHPCAHCAATIVQSGITRVVMCKENLLGDHWRPSEQLAKEIFNEANVMLGTL